MKKLIQYLLYIITSILAILIIFIEIMTLIDYKPDKETVLARNHAQTITQDTISILSWNIGYAGLNADMDFFYEGGYKTRTSKEQTLTNLNAICDFLHKNDSIDIILLQEVDLKARRSYNINQLNYLSEALPKHTLYFAKDYDVAFVPLPITNPMGTVQSGIATLSRLASSECIQYAYPSQGKWPTHLFQIDNCFITTRYPLKNGKELIVVNTHNSAYDEGEKRSVEMSYLQALLLDEYNKGNYVIAGGDWNQTPPIADSMIKYDNKLNPEHSKFFIPLPISPDFMPLNWQWVSDRQATNRFLYEPYKQGRTAETLLDFFLISPNIQVVSTKTINLNFYNSDHNPINLIIKLKFNITN